MFYSDSRSSVKRVLFKYSLDVPEGVDHSVRHSRDYQILTSYCLHLRFKLLPYNSKIFFFVFFIKVNKVIVSIEKKKKKKK